MPSSSETLPDEINRIEPTSLNNSPIAYGLGSFGLESAYKVFVGFYIFYYVDVLGLAVALAAFPEEMRQTVELDAELSSTSQPLVEPLSVRELEVLRLMATGLKYNEIAGKLVISVNTVRHHTRNIYGKLVVNNRAQAVARAQDLGLL